MARKFDLTPYQTTNLVELADLTSDLHRTRWLHPADWLGQVINTPKRELDGRNERCVWGGGGRKMGESRKGEKDKVWIQSKKEIRNKERGRTQKEIIKWQT